jgi:Uma2 family endonuclease
MQTQTRTYTPEEYLELEANADYKSEYRDGEIIPMTGGTTNHNEIALNLAGTLKLSLRRQNYKVYIGDVRLWIPRYRQYTYPDVMVVQGQPIYTGTNTTTITNPQIIVEVLSPSTQNYDQGDKFMYYRSIPEMQEYILIDQKQFHVMQHSKTPEGKWLMSEYEGEDAVLELSTIEFKTPFQDLYEGVDFSNLEASNEE